MSERQRWFEANDIWEGGGGNSFLPNAVSVTECCSALNLTFCLEENGVEQRVGT